MPSVSCFRPRRFAHLRLLLLAMISTSGGIVCAQSTEHALSPFRKIVVSPLINVVLTQGTQESVRLEYENVSPDQINYVVRGNTLRLYLDGAKMNVPKEKRNENGRVYKRPLYKGAKVTAYVTYRELNALQVRGEEEVDCSTPIVNKKFKLKMYGESTVRLAALETDYLKAGLYGENRLEIRSGKARTQRYRLFGENRVDAEKLKCQNLSTSSFGESKLNVAASKKLNVTTFGESEITYRGNARLRKTLTLGETSISRVKKR